MSADIRHAFIDGDGVVVQTIVGDLPDAQLEQLMNDYVVLFNAADVVSIDDPNVTIWIGGRYDSIGGFTPPPAPTVPPDPLPEPIVEMTDGTINPE